MQVIQGYYDNGVFTPDWEMPHYTGRVTLTLLDEVLEEEVPKKFTTEEALAMIDKFAGSVKGVFDAKTDRLAYLEGKYGSID